MNNSSITRRRALLAASGFALSFLAAGQERRSGVKKLGMFCQCGPDSFDEFRKRLEERGWIEGKNLEVMRRFARSGRDAASFATLAKEIVDFRPDVIMSYLDDHTRALRAATATIPIVTTVRDPVAMGLAKSLKQPGGNVTGLALDAGSAVEVRIDILRRLLPRLDTIYLMSRAEAIPPSDPRYVFHEEAARKFGLRFKIAEAPGTSFAQYEEALKTIPPGGTAALLAGLLLPATPEKASQEQLMGAFARARVPACFQNRLWVEHGGLASYGLEHEDPYGRVAALIDRMLRGGDPALTPWELPAKSDLAINRKTAATLGIQIPQDLQIRADAVFG